LPASPPAPLPPCAQRCERELALAEGKAVANIVFARVLTDARTIADRSDASRTRVLCIM